MVDGTNDGGVSVSSRRRRSKGNDEERSRGGKGGRGEKLAAIIIISMCDPRIDNYVIVDELLPNQPPTGVKPREPLVSDESLVETSFAAAPSQLMRTTMNDLRDHQLLAMSMTWSSTSRSIQYDPADLSAVGTIPLDHLTASLLAWRCR